MAADSENDRRKKIESQEVFELLLPLKREEVNWAATYWTYRELPDCQRQILDLLIGGADPKQVARQLGVAWSTIRTQIQTLRKKFAVDSNQELVILLAIALYETAQDLGIANEQRLPQSRQND